MTAVKATGQSGEIFDTWLYDFQWDVTELTYSFPTNGGFYSYQSYFQVFEMTEAQKDAARRALDEISSFTNLTFTEVTETASNEATLRFVQERNLAGAYAYLPTSVEQGGDVFMGSGSQDPVIGNEAYVFFTHEIGHAMGLEHGHESEEFYNSGFDSQEYTVVTYSDYSMDEDISSYDSGPVDWAQSYQMLDIAAMQYMYGANFSSTGEVWSGDTTYTFSETTGEMFINGVGQGTPAGNRIFRTIWDGHGEDTYDLRNYTTDVVIDLQPGAWSTFDPAQLADLDRTSSDPARIASGNVANALLYQGDLRSLIENVVGGTGSDKITGNEIGNVILAKGGKDKLRGGEGDDELRGQAGGDLIKGQAGNDLLFGGNGNDTLIGGKGYDQFTGGEGSDTFQFKSVNESKPGSTLDKILDFEIGIDVLDLSHLADAPLTYVEGNSVLGSGPSVAVFEKNNKNTVVLADADGDGSVDVKFYVARTLGLTEDDFLL